MTIAFTPPVEGFPVPLGVIVASARRWRRARQAREAVQPALFSLLARHGQRLGVLAPVLDSLFLLYQSALGRSMALGEGAMLSSDEYLLLGFVGGVKERRDSLDCLDGVAIALDCAIRSARIMLALVASEDRQPVPLSRALVLS